MLYIDGTKLPVGISLSVLGEDKQDNLTLLQFSSTSLNKGANNVAEGRIDYHLLIDRLKQVVFQLDTKQNFIFLNPAWQRIFYYRQEESLDKPLLSFIHPEDLPLV